MKVLNWKRVSLHSLFWVVYVPLNAMINCILNRQLQLSYFYESLFGEALTLPLKMAFTYFVFYYIIPLYLDSSRVWKLIALIFGSFLVSTFLYRLMLAYIITPLTNTNDKINIWFLPGILASVFDLFITISAACIIKMIRLNYKSQEFEQQLIREKLQSELNFLRAQTNPHFLFNTLNNLYVLAWKKSDKTADAIMMLSKIMRFVLYDCRASRIPISAETQVIKDYLELEKLRYNQRLKIEYTEQIDDPNTLIAPLLLLPFVENSFKHGANSTTGKVLIQIELTLEKQEFRFKVGNTMEKNEEIETPEGIGLQNVKRQLELIYPQKHALKTEFNQDFYQIELRIDVED